MDLSLPCLALIKQFYTALRAQGGGNLGTQALIKVLENMNNHKIVKWSIYFLYKSDDLCLFSLNIFMMIAVSM